MHIPVAASAIEHISGAESAIEHIPGAKSAIEHIPGTEWCYVYFRGYICSKESPGELTC